MPAGKDPHPLGIDVGGTGVKGAPVDLDAGDLAEDRLKLDTPTESTPEAVAAVIAKIADHFPGDGDERAIGITVPAVVMHGTVRSAANIDKSWIGTDAESLLRETLGAPVTVVNDADAAGLAEARYGAAKGVQGVVLVTTLGTGIGSALIHDGVLVPNTEFGHIEVDGHDAESRASAVQRERRDWTWEKWAEHLDRYYAEIEKLLSPDLIIVGGGVSKKSEKFLPLLHLQAKIIPAKLQNNAGIVGAALIATEVEQHRH